MLFKQRLEFLGDAVLDYLITSYLYSVYPNLKPGQLTDLRSTCVNNICFANIAISRSFYKYIISESSGLCKSMEKYVLFSRTHQLNENLVEVPPCPKVNTVAPFSFFSIYIIISLIIFILFFAIFNGWHQSACLIFFLHRPLFVL